jgi:hypothetical protein
MSTPIRNRRHAGTHRRGPGSTGHAARRPAPADRARDRRRPDETPFWERHHWLVPLVAVGAVVGAFVMMILLTALAGGSTPFTG